MEPQKTGDRLSADDLALSYGHALPETPDPTTNLLITFEVEPKLLLLFALAYDAGIDPERLTVLTPEQIIKISEKLSFEQRAHLPVVAAAKIYESHFPTGELEYLSQILILREDDNEAFFFTRIEEAGIYEELYSGASLQRAKSTYSNFCRIDATPETELQKRFLALAQGLLAVDHNLQDLRSNRPHLDSRELIRRLGTLRVWLRREESDHFNPTRLEELILVQSALVERLSKNWERFVDKNFLLSRKIFLEAISAITEPPSSSIRTALQQFIVICLYTAVAVSMPKMLTRILESSEIIEAAQARHGIATYIALRAAGATHKDFQALFRCKAAAA